MSNEPLMLLPASALEAARKRPLRKGHAGTPGDGPASETCGSCDNFVRRHYAKVYLKCDLTRANWTGGGGTDVRARDPACPKWAVRVGPVREEYSR